MPIGEQFRSFYPGLIPIEQRLWREWLKVYEADFDWFEYNVHVGEGLRAPERAITDDPEFDQKMREMWRKLTQRKIDVIGRKQGVIWIFEVEQRPGTRALGQLLFYETLLPKTRPMTEPTQLALIAERIGDDVLVSFEEHAVTVWRVELPD